EPDPQARRGEREPFVSTLAQLPPLIAAGGDGTAAAAPNDPPTRLRRLQSELADLRTHLAEKPPDAQQKIRDPRAPEAEIAATPPPAPVNPAHATATGGPLDPSRIGIVNYQRVLSMDRE